ncbi:DUF637 domain-containing protein [Psychrobacter sp. M13]|uniref:two-partner secretion domain-containing protein n=1 Tax=Psychrobacter sp. M13 TaxID=3067275 RepID=UPI00273C65E6|nr:DUF637 domain-containing protein [Psychrobacter sp. M13]WLP94210.1 DUF637 domain-containing protein [Psychrobacter sp. M13]
MNKHCYRVVFNKARGMMMVVSEAAKSNSKTAGDGSRNNVSNTKIATSNSSSLSRLVVAILCCQSMVYTQVQAATSQIQNTASNIPTSQRAALLKAANGTPIVNIRTPNSNGLSHNTYNQFDIGSNGAILNNSMGGANTQLAGTIAGNQYLGKNVANTILNEVRSNAPAKFQGNLEVAGQRADIVIASPSGLQIQGGGFINANRATLTTGTPKIDSAGNLTGFDVKQGTVQFDNAATGSALGGVLYDGKNKNQANYVDVLARAVVINGQIHATQDVDIVVGSNTVDYDTGAATKTTGTGIAPTLAVDVSTLGGIYANSINLIGNESGLGVRNAGNIKATQQVVLTASGKIENTGAIETTKAQTSLVSVNATGTTGSIEHSGIISSYGMIDVQADKDITLNKGIIKKNNAGTAVQLMPDIIRIDAGGSLKVSNSSDVRNLTVDDQTNIYTHSTLDTTVDSKSAIASNGGISIEADRYAQLKDTSSISAGSAALSISSKSGTTVDNATVTGRGDVYIASATADTTISNNSQLSAQKSLAISGGRDAIIKSGSRVVNANELKVQAIRDALIENTGGIKVTANATLQAGEHAQLNNNSKPITAGKQLTVEGKRATVSNSIANATDGIYIISQGQHITVGNSTLDSEKGAVTAIANQSALYVYGLKANANSTILAATNNINIFNSTLNADNIVIESGDDTNIDQLTTTAKNINQTGGTSVTSKSNTNIVDTSLSSAGNITVRSDLSLRLNNNDIQAQGIVLKTSNDKTPKDAGGLNNRNGDISLRNTKLTATNSADIGLIVDAANYLEVLNSNVTSTTNSTLKSGNVLMLNNSQISAGKNLAIDSSDRLTTNGDLLSGYTDSKTNNIFHGFNQGITTLQADEILSINSNSTQSYRNANITGGAVLINSDANINFDDSMYVQNKMRINATGNTKLAASKEKLIDGKAVNTLDGDLAITSSTGNLTIDPKNITLNATGDLSLAARGGQLYLKGYKGTQGLGSEQVVKLNTAGNINLSGKSVLIEGSDLISGNIVPIRVVSSGPTVTHQNGTVSSSVTIGYQDKITPTGGINITATDGSVELKGVKNSFSNYVSPYKISTINSEIANAQAELNQPFSDTKWVEEFNKQKADWTQFVYVDCIKSPFRSSSECRQKRINDMGIAERSRPNYFKMTKSANYEEYTSYLSRQETLRGTLSDLNQVLATSQKASTGYEHKASSIVAGKDINITAKQGVLIEGADISSSLGGINILAEGNLAPIEVKDADDKTVGLNYDSIRITGLADIYQQGNINSKGEVTGNNYSYHQLINQPKLTADKNIIISAKGARPVNQASIVFIDNNAVVLNSADIKSYNGDVRIDAALGDINLEASQVAFMDGSQTTTTKRKWYGKKKTTTTTKTSFNTNAVTTDIAAKNIKLTAESDINIYGSELTADPKGTIGITAGRLNNLYKVEDRSVSETDIKSKSSFLGIRYNKNHTNDTRQELSQLPAVLAANSAALKSGGDTLIQGSIFNTENANTIQVGYGKYADANANVILQAITNQIKTTHTQDKESTLWMKTVKESDTVTAAQLPKFNQAPTITLPDGGSIIVDIPVEITIDRNKKAKEAISKSSEELGRIALELSKQPGYEYLAELDKNNDIDWQQVNLIQEHFAFEQEGLTPAAAALIAIAVTIALQGMDGGGIATSLLGQQSAVAATAATATSAATVGTASTVTTLGLAGNAAMATLASQAAVTLINNKGDISKTLKQLASSATIRSMATAALTAGIGAQLGLGSAATDPFNQKLVNAVGSGMTDAFVNAAINGVSLEDALKNSLRNALVDVFAAETFSSFVKGIDTNEFADNLAHKLVAAGVGCISASAKKQSCDAGALGAAIGEMLGDYLVDDPSKLTAKQKADIINASKLLAGSVALLTNVDVNTAANSAGMAVENNAVLAIPVVALVAVIGGIAYVVSVPANKQHEVARALYKLGSNTIALGKDFTNNTRLINTYMIGQIGSGINIHISPAGRIDPKSGILINPQQKNPFAGIPGLEIQDFNSVLNGLGKPISNNGVTILVKPSHAKNPSDYVIYNLSDTWSRGTHPSSEASLEKHFKDHGAEVGATDKEQYLRKAEGFKQNLRGATKSPVPGGTEGVIRHKKLDKYIDLAPDGTIISFGKS